MLHAQVHQAALAVHGYGGKDHVAAGLALELKDQMVPRLGRGRWTRSGGSYPLVPDVVPHAPGMAAGQVTLRAKVIARAAGALAHVKLKRLRCARIVHVEVQVKEKMRGAVVRAQGLEPHHGAKAARPRKEREAVRRSAQRRRSNPLRHGKNRRRRAGTGEHAGLPSGELLYVWNYLGVAWRVAGRWTGAGTWRRVRAARHRRGR